MALGKDYASQNCSIARALEVIGERWTLLVVRDAFYGVTRYNDFLSHLGAPRAVLAARLQTLERAGVLEKRQYQESPARFEYVLTPSGIELWPILMSLYEWGSGTAGGDRNRVFRHVGCGAELGPYGLCPSCGLVPPQDVEMLPGEGLNHNPSNAISKALLKPHRMLTPLEIVHS